MSYPTLSRPGRFHRTLALAASISMGAFLAVIAVSAADSKADPKPPAGEKPAASAFKNVDAAQFEKLRADKKNVVLDVRTRKEFEAGHIPGATLIDWNSPDFAEQVAKLDRNKTYLVHCAGGVRSAKACDKMNQLKFADLYNLEGGFKAWEKAGNKPEK
jgi:rhodanese-related sulfurtransferase